MPATRVETGGGLSSQIETFLQPDKLPFWSLTRKYPRQIDGNCKRRTANEELKDVGSV